MQLLENISNLVRSWCSAARMPQIDARTPHKEYGVEALESFLEHRLKTEEQHGERMLFADDMENIFERTNIRANWTIARMDLSVFRVVLEKSGHTGICLWFEGKEPPQAILLGEQVLDCTVIGRGEQLQVLSSGRRIGDAYAMRGWVGPKPEIIGWLAMIYSDQVA